MGLPKFAALAPRRASPRLTRRWFPRMGSAYAPGIPGSVGSASHAFGSGASSTATPIAVSGISSAVSTNFTVDNALLTANQAAIMFPTGAMTTPATSSNGWLLGLSFTVSQGFQYLSNSEFIAHSGSQAGASNTGAALTVAQAGNASPFSASIYIRNGGSNFISASSITLGTLVRGHSYSFVMGQMNSAYCIIGLFDITAQTWVYWTTTVAVSRNIASMQIFNGLGCAAGIASGQAYGFSGRVGNAWMLTGTAGFTAPTQIQMQNIFNNVSTIASLATALGLSVQYSNALDPTTGYAADSTGSVTTAMTAISKWTPSVTPINGDAVQVQQWLSIAPEADGAEYVWGIVPRATSGNVWFRGTYATSNGVTPTFEVLLTRKDGLGATGGFGVWTPLQGVVASGGSYYGYVVAPSGVGFTRSIRFTGQPATAYLSAEKHAVGLVIPINAQSQGSGLFDITSNGNTGSSMTAVTPTNTANVYGCVMRPPSGLVEALPSVAVRPLYPSSRNWSSTTQGVGGIGDGALALIEKLKSLTNLPVMLIYMTNGGHSPQDFYSDRQTVICAGSSTNGWTGAASSFTISLLTTTTPALQVKCPFMDGHPNSLGGAWPVGSTIQIAPSSLGGASPIVIPGTLAGTISGATGGTIALTDNGSGAISGTNGTLTISGTITYNTYGGFPSIAMTVTGGTIDTSVATLNLTWNKVSDYTVGTNTPKTTLNGFTQSGVLGTPHSGQAADAYIALWKNQVTAIAIPWWTTLVPNTFYSGTGTTTHALNQAALWPHLDALRYWHKQAPNCAGAHFFYAPSARDLAASGLPSSGGSELAVQYGGHRCATYAYVAANPTDCHLLADVPDSTVWGGNQSGPHEDWAGYQHMGQRYAVSLAAGLGYGPNLASGPTGNPAIPSVPVLGPILTGVVRTNATTLTLTFSLPNGTSLSSYGGSTSNGTTIVGFEVGISATSQSAAFAARAIASGVITSATTITITTASMTGNFVSLSYCAGYSVFTGTSQYAVDGATMQSLLCDNYGGYTLPVAVTIAAGTGIGPAAGNAAQAVLDWAA